MSISYGVSIPSDAPNREAAVLFLESLLDPDEGLRVLAEQGQPVFEPPFLSPVSSTSSVPWSLTPLLEGFAP